MVDGCCEEGDIIDFRLPLRAACGKYLTPTAKNIYNKFSVRFFLKIVLVVAQNYYVKTKKDRDDYGDESEENERQYGEEDDIEVLERYEEESAVDSNFIEVNFYRWVTTLCQTD